MQPSRWRPLLQAGLVTKHTKRGDFKMYVSILTTGPFALHIAAVSIVRPVHSVHSAHTDKYVSLELDICPEALGEMRLYTALIEFPKQQIRIRRLPEFVSELGIGFV
jgi:hypothetical protein